MNLFKANFSHLIAFAALTVFSLIGNSVEAVRNRYYDEEQAYALREIKAIADTLRHEVRNHETEIQTFDEKLRNLDIIIESLRDQIIDADSAQKERLREFASSLESKIFSTESTSKGVVADLRQFKTHTNEIVESLSAQREKIAQLEKIVEQQNETIEHLQAALQALMDGLQKEVEKKISKSEAGKSQQKIYKVKAGDSLEKVARHNQTTVQVIKELNKLSNDRIVIGQQLILPEK